MPPPIYVARHAETVFGAQSLVNGDPSVDNPLTEAGIGQSEELARRLGDTDFGLCITTEFPRTKQTADLILAGRAVPREVVADLNDPKQGRFEGKDFESYAKWMDSTGIDDRIPGGGESQIDCMIRYSRGWRTVVEKAGSSLLVVAHAFPISVALTLHEDQPPMLRREYERDPGFAELNVLDAERLGRGLDALDEELRAHLS